MVKLVVLDLDGTLTAHPSVWQHIHEALGTWEGKGEVHLRRFLSGEISYTEFARLDAAEWRGIPIEEIRKIVSEISILDGARELVQDLKNLGAKTVIISSGLDVLAERVAETLGIDEHYSNRLRVDQDGKLTGEVEVIIPADGKGAFFQSLLKERNISPREAIAIGDGPSDIPMFQISRISFAVNASEEVGSKATYHVRDLGELRERLKKVLGTED